MEIRRTDLSEIPIRGSENPIFAIFHADELHLVSVDEGPLIVPDENTGFGIEWVFGVSWYSEEFIETMMSRAIEDGLGEIDVVEIKVVGNTTMRVTERHPDVIFADGGGAIAVFL